MPDVLIDESMEPSVCCCCCAGVLVCSSGARGAGTNAGVCAAADPKSDSIFDIT
ncbi:hypothetical protein [Saccharopolyspora spinosa]|uniref:hypothetical protein n=1 Tax=Saccharopolyspora spinosa TaxID=60894 RepID=UPI001ED906AE|nr:hypothetical protein [Saccharopolyspora spinosa]